MRIANLPYQYVPNPARGTPIFNGSMYLGQPDLDPKITLNQISVSIQQEDGSIVPVSQPIQTGSGGVPIYNGSPAIILVNEPVFSIKVEDNVGTQKFYQARASSIESAILYTSNELVVDTLEGVTNSLESLIGVSNGTVVRTKGYRIIGDGGDGVYCYDSGSSATVNGGTVINYAGGVGRWLLLHEGIANLKQFGSNSGDAAIDAAALQAAADTGMPIYGPANGIYKANLAVLNNFSEVVIFGDGNSSVFDFSDGGVFDIFSTVSALPDLSSNISAGDNSLSFVSAHGLSQGDVVVAYNPTDYSFSSFRAYYRDGCMFRISSVPTSATAVFYGVSPKQYLSASMDMYKINGGKVVLKNFKVIPPPSGIAFWIDAHQSVQIENVEIAAGAADTAIEVYRCFDVKVKNLKSTALSGGAYPIVLANSQKITITESSLYSNRHCIGIGGRTGNAAVPSRDIIIDHCILENDGSLGLGAADIHGGCENVVYSNCYMNSHANMAGKNVSYLNCTIMGRPPSYFADGSCIYGSEVVGGTYTIEGCKFITYGNNLSFGCVTLNVDLISEDFRLIFKNNFIENRGTGSASARLIKLSVGDASPPASRIDLVVDGLTYKAPAAGVAVVSVSGINNISATSSYIVDNIDAPSGMPLMAFSLAANNTASMRLQRQSFKTTVTTPGGTSFQVASSTWTFRYPYPRLPVVTVSAASFDGATQSAFTGGKICVPFVRSYSATTSVLAISSGDGANFTGSSSVGIFAEAQINEL